MKRILVFPNITYGGHTKDLTKDSYIQFLSKFLFSMKVKRDDIFWYIILPTYKKKKRRKEDKKQESEQVIKTEKMLSYPNIHFIHIEIPPAPFNRIHFNHFEMIKKLDWRDCPIDMIFTNQPEITTNLKSLFYDASNLKPKIFGYCHWFDFKKQINWESQLNSNILGILEMETCYLNTQSQKDLVLSEVKEVFSDKVIKTLNEKLVVLPPSITESMIRPSVKPYENIIVFNHRPNKEKSFNQFISVIKTLWEKRQDFKVWIPLLKPSDKLNKEEWVYSDRWNNKKKYYDELRKCAVGISPKQPYGGWSISTTDGNMCGVPYIMYDSENYKELNPNADFYSSDEELVKLLDKYLTDKSHRNKMSVQCIDNLKKNHNFIKKIDIVSKKIDQIYDSIKTMDTLKMDYMIDLVKDYRVISHKDLLNNMCKSGWGKNIKILPYRKTLLSTKGISEVLLKKETGSRGGKRYEWKSIYQFNI